VLSVVVSVDDNMLWKIFLRISKPTWHDIEWNFHKYLSYSVNHFELTTNTTRRS